MAEPQAEHSQSVGPKVIRDDFLERFAQIVNMILAVGRGRRNAVVAITSGEVDLSRNGNDFAPKPGLSGGS